MPASDFWFLDDKYKMSSAGYSYKVSILSHKVRLNRYSKGFTLVELLVVIAIIGVLATLVLLQLGVARAKARDTKRIGDVNQIRTGLELFADDYSGYPAFEPLSGYANFLTYFASGAVPVDPSTAAAYPYGTGGAGACAAGNITARQYHTRAELERDTNALDTDSDINSTTFNATLCGTRIDDSVPGVSEVCGAGALDCQFDLGQR